MGLVDFFSKINRTAKDSKTAMVAGLEGLGLKVTSQKGAVSDLAGKYKEREVIMNIDASNVMGAGKAAMIGGAASALAGAVGLFPRGFQSWTEQDASYHARDMMQRAQMLYRWAMLSRTAAPANVNISHNKKMGQEIAKKLYARADESVMAILRKQEVLSALQAAHFDEISINEKNFKAFWAPQMSEYQNVVASPAHFTQAVRNTLDALSILCDQICGSGT